MHYLQNMNENESQKSYIHVESILKKIILILCTQTVSTLRYPKNVLIRIHGLPPILTQFT